MHLVTATNRSFAAVFLYRICWQTILFCLPAVALPAGLPPYSEAALQAWWKSRPDDADFHGESEKLKNQLLASQNEPGTDLPQLFSQTNFLGWLELACWLDN